MKNALATAWHHISHAPNYYYDHFFCPIKRDVTIATLSSLSISISWFLNYISDFLEHFGEIWGIIAKVLSGVILLMNFVIVSLTLGKRIRDWGKPEPTEGKQEYEKRNDK